MRPKFLSAAALIAGLMLAGCQNQQQVLDQSMPAAVQVALNNGQFALNCPMAQATVLSRNLLMPASPYLGLERAEYTIGVSGCDQRAIYLTMCQIGSVSCIAVRTDRT